MASTQPLLPGAPLPATRSAGPGASADGFDTLVQEARTSDSKGGAKASEAGDPARPRSSDTSRRPGPGASAVDPAQALANLAPDQQPDIAALPDSPPVSPLGEAVEPRDAAVGGAAPDAVPDLQGASTIPDPATRPDPEPVTAPQPAPAPAQAQSEPAGAADAAEPQPGASSPPSSSPSSSQASRTGAGTSAAAETADASGPADAPAATRQVTLSADARPAPEPANPAAASKAGTPSEQLGALAGAEAEAKADALKASPAQANVDDAAPAQDAATEPEALAKEAGKTGLSGLKAAEADGTPRRRAEARDLANTSAEASDKRTSRPASQSQADAEPDMSVARRGDAQSVDAIQPSQAGRPASPALIIANAALFGAQDAQPADPLSLDASGEPVGELSLDPAAPRAEARADAVRQPAQAGQAARFLPHTIQHVAARIAQTAADGGRTVDIRLDPPELGRVEVRLELGPDNTVRALLAAERPETLAELQRSARDLERALADAGLDLADDGLQFSLSQDQAGQGGETDGSAGRYQPYVIDAAALDTAAPSLPAELYGFAVAPSVRLDMRA